MDASASDTLDNIVVNLKPKRFQCARCQRRFARLEHLQRHERTHTRERPFPCERCDSRFTRSDLLIRHERLSHGNTRASSRLQKSLDKVAPSKRAVKRSRPKKTHTDNQEAPGEFASPAPPDPFSSLPPSPAYTTSGYTLGDFPNTGLEPFRPSVCRPPEGTAVDSMQLPDDATVQPTITGATQGHSANGSIDSSLDRFTGYLEANTLAAYHLPSPDTVGQDDFLFPFEPFIGSNEENDVFNRHQLQVDITYTQQASFSCFCSRLPSIQPDQQSFDANLGPPVGQSAGHRRVFDVTCDERELILQRTADFADVIPDFQLPTGLSLSRYIRGYVDGFHEHLPFLHIQSMSASTSSIELLLAMAAVGAQYCFESEKGVSLFHAARAIANERIRRRDAGLTSSFQQNNHPASASISPSQSTGIRLPSTDEPAAGNPPCDLIQTAQALLILMAMATWSKHGELLREALAIQSVLASIIREDGLRMPTSSDRDIASWEAMMSQESVIRTKYIVFCFFNLHCILYDIPPLILSSELLMKLPCTAAEFRADTAAAWEEARRCAAEPSSFQDAIRWLFSSSSPGQETATRQSSLANYVLIHGIIQHIFFVRQTARCRIDLPDSDLTQEDRASLERALRNWQLSWELSPESCLDPTSAQGPVAFNSTALLRLAHVRLAVDTGPERALGTRDPIQIANALRNAPPVKRCPNLTRALLHSAHALSIPIKIGIRLVAKTQTFIWSIQHSLSSLECALLLSKWLAAISAARWPSTDAQLTADERRILGLVKTMLDETEFAVPDEVSLDIATAARQLNIGMLRVWATVFRSSQTWRIVDVIGSSLDLYADVLEAAS